MKRRLYDLVAKRLVIGVFGTNVRRPIVLRPSLSAYVGTVWTSLVRMISRDEGAVCEKHRVNAHTPSWSKVSPARVMIVTVMRLFVHPLKPN